MNNIKISYLNISPYSRHSPSLQLKTDLKKQSNSVERPKSSKVSYTGVTARGQTPVNNPDSIERKYSQLGDKKSELMASLYQISKPKQKEKPNTAKVYKAKEVQLKKTPKTVSRGADKINEKLAIYQYLQNRSSKKSEESKIMHPSMQQTPSRQLSKNNILEDKDQSHERRMLEASILQQRQLMEALEEMHRTKSKQNGYSQNQNNLALLLKSAQRPSQTNTGKAAQFSNQQQNSLTPVNRGQDDRKKTGDSKKTDLFKDLKLNMNFQEFINQKERAIPQPPPENEVVLKKQHRRGLSSGQNPLNIDQFAIEQERIRQIQMLQLQQQQQLQLQLQLQQQQQQQQQQQPYIQDPQQEEDEFYEQFFHMDKMTFDFEKLVVTQKLSHPNFYTPSTSPVNNKQISHSRTKSIEEPNSLMPTKSSSRWTTKRSSVGDDPQYAGGRENFNLIEQISDLDRTDEKEEFKRLYKR